MNIYSFEFQPYILAFSTDPIIGGCEVRSGQVRQGGYYSNYLQFLGKVQIRYYQSWGQI